MDGALVTSIDTGAFFTSTGQSPPPPPSLKDRKLALCLERLKTPDFEHWPWARILVGWGIRIGRHLPYIILVWLEDICLSVVICLWQPCCWTMPFESNAGQLQAQNCHPHYIIEVNWNQGTWVECALESSLDWIIMNLCSVHKMASLRLVNPIKINGGGEGGWPQGCKKKKAATLTSC